MSETVAILLRDLVDDAGLFPPTALPMRQALARHRADRTVGHPMHTGRLLCPVGALPELCSRLDDGERVDVGVVFDTERELLGDGGAADPRTRITHYEIRASGPDVGKAARYLRTAARPVRGRRFLSRRLRTPAAPPPIYVEFDRGREGRENIAQLSGVPGLGARISCGGASEEAFPDPDEVAAFIVACADHGVPFRVAAGPHHAVRHTDPLTGFVPLGYLNLLAATAGALAGDGPNRVARVLAVTDPDRLLARVRGIDGATAVGVRELFVGYGSCSTRDPVVDAERLGLLDPALPWPT
ncbi:hypothetical protein NI17_014080 [Thermobifida halotolerans]|uniref:Uncharacterized protein n=1 Tax=Thermobifida halotolerans TaxID=483545 RepID=A0A399G1E8_9ACTN|nr:hypothetical protein [Thermobifida halotolerans]UOE17987.1 hypothetical protein NI17_014080 [Thermobifida halotolerans]